MKNDFPADSPIGRRILELAADGKVSDFYISPHQPLCIRRDGRLFFDTFVWEPESLPEPQPGCFDYALDIGDMRFRVSRMMTQGKFRWVLRLLPKEIPAPEKISVPMSALKAFLEAKNGLFLICGATGSGKSTTIASMVRHRAMRRREHVITFEDPIEFVYEGDYPSLISQREVGSDELDFANALRAALRQAPDVIIVGEIRDGVTAETALQAAETGHAVVATLHTSTAAQTVQRFLKLIPSERADAAQATLADTLRLVMCQRLLFDVERNRRFPIHEVLLQYDGVVNLIRRGEFKKLDQELETGWKRGMFNFEKSLQIREEEGFRSAMPAPTGFGSDDVEAFLSAQQILER